MVRMCVFTIVESMRRMRNARLDKDTGMADFPDYVPPPPPPALLAFSK